MFYLDYPAVPFYFNELISYRLEKNLIEEKENFQFEKFIINVFKLSSSLNREVLFTGSGGNELFIYSDKIFHIVPTFYKTLQTSFSYILEEYNCKLFNII